MPDSPVTAWEPKHIAEPRTVRPHRLGPLYELTASIGLVASP